MILIGIIAYCRGKKLCYELVKQPEISIMFEDEDFINEKFDNTGDDFNGNDKINERHFNFKSIPEDEINYHKVSGKKVSID